MFIINKITSIGVIGAICGVSIVINILALPLYNIADSIQEKERQINKKMEYRVYDSHLTFPNVKTKEKFQIRNKVVLRKQESNL